MSLREIRLPALSATMEGATVLSWLVAPGDTVSEGQAIAEVSTDKVDMDVEAPFAGTIAELLAEPGDTVALGAVLATVETEADDLLGGLSLGGETGEAATVETPVADVVEPSREAAASVGAGGIVPASPPARKLARDLGIDLAAVAATGRRGQVTPADVRAYVEARDAGTAPAPEPSRPEPAPERATPAAAPDDAEEARRLSIRRATADVMGRSASIPQFTLWRTLVLDRAAARKDGRSWTTELVRALGGALRAHPGLNRRWSEDERTTVPFEGVRVGLAVDRPGTGLVVATLADPDLGDPADADRSIRALADRARIGKLRPEDMAQASITLSNLGGFGVDRFTALLFPPQAAILSVGSIAMRPVATGEGALKAALTCEIGLTVDHRVGDGADGARLLATFAELIERGG